MSGWDIAKDIAGFVPLVGDAIDVYDIIDGTVNGDGPYGPAALALLGHIPVVGTALDIGQLALDIHETGGSPWASQDLGPPPDAIEEPTQSVDPNVAPAYDDPNGTCNPNDPFSQYEAPPPLSEYDRLRQRWQEESGQ